MVAIVTGNGFGLERTSGWVLGSRGQLGAAGLGRSGEGVTVNAANGNLIIQNTDEMLFGLGPNEIVSRTYNSLTTYGDHDNGDKWQQSYARHIEATSGTLNTSGSTVTLIDWDGSNVVYTWDTVAGAYLGKEGAGAYDKVEWASGSSRWKWTDGDSRIQELFESSAGSLIGRLVSRLDLDGNGLTFTYDGTSGLLTKVTTTTGGTVQEFTTFNYWSGTSNLKELVTSRHADNNSGGSLTNLTRVRYEYDGYNRLTKVTVDLSPEDNVVSDSNTYYTNYSYATDTQIGGVIDRRVSLITQKDGSSLAISYTSDGTYRVESLIQTVASGVTRKTKFAYGAGYTYVQQFYDAGANDYHQTTLNYDAAGQLTSVVAPAPVASGSTLTTTFTYNTNGDVISVTDASGKTVTYDDTPNAVDATGYDANGNSRLSRDSAGNTVTRTYGSNNEVLTETRYLTPDPDGSGASAATTPVTTRYAYDSENHLRYIVSAEGHVVEYRYDAPGNPTRVIEYLGNTYAGATFTESDLETWSNGLNSIAKSQTKLTVTTYDLRGNPATVSTYENTQADGTNKIAAASGASSVVAYFYDQVGNLLSRTVDSTVETYLYDGLNRLKFSTDFNNTSTLIALNDAARTDTVTVATGTASSLAGVSIYDQAGELISYQDAGATQSAYSYDKLGRLRISTDPTGLKTYFLYDHDSRMVGTVAADGALTEYIYNADSQVVATVQYKTLLTSANLTTTLSNGAGSSDMPLVELSAVRPASNPADRWSWNVYDNAQRLIETIDAAGAATVYAYDGASRLVSTTQYARVIDPGTNTADFNGDGRADLLFRNSSTGEVYVWNSQGGAGGTFTGQSVGTPTSDWVIQKVGDFNGDGKSDILFRNSTTGEVYAWNSNAGATVAFTGYSFGTLSSDWSVIAVGDFNGDGKSDILFKATSTGMYATWDVIGNSVSGGGNLGTASGYLFVGVGDFDGDGRSDLLFRNTSNGSYASWQMNDTTILVGGVTIGTPYSGATFAGTGDFNGDGRSDILFKESSGAYTVWDLNGVAIIGGGGLGTPTSGLTLAAVTDLNSDGKSDLLFIDGAGAYSSWLVNDTAISAGPGYSAPGAAWPLLNGLTSAGSAQATLASFKITPPTSLVLPTADAANDRVTRNFYDNDGRLIYTLDADGYMIRVIYDGGGQKIETVAYANVTSSTLWASGTYTQLLASFSADTAKDIHNYFVYDQRGYLRATIDGEGDITRYDYTTLGDVSTVIRGYRIPSWTLPSTPYSWGDIQTLLSGYGSQVVDKTVYTRTLYGQVLSETRYLVSSTTETDSYTYDELRRVTIRTTAVGTADERTTKFRYDSKGNLWRELTGEGSVALAALGGSPTQTQIDDVWNKYGVRYTYDDAHRLISRIDPDGSTAAGNQSLYYYDVDGRLRYAVNALGEVAEYAYNTFGERSDITIRATRISSLSGLTGGQITSGLTTALTTTASDSLTHLDYGVTGTLNQSITYLDSAGTTAVSTYAYNAFRQLVTQTDPLDASNAVQTTRAYSRRGLLLTTTVDTNFTTAYRYDAFGRTDRTTDPNGAYRYVTYDRASRVATTVDALGYTTGYAYDGRGNLVTRTDRLGYATTFAYDQLERSVVMRTPEGAVGGLNFTTTAASNAYGQVKSVTDGEGRTTTYTYTKDGAVKTVTDGVGNVITSAYDMVGRLSTMTDARNVVTKFTYDAANRVASRIVDYGGLGLTTSYQYDAKGQQIQVTDPAGVVTTVAYDRGGRRTTITVDPGSSPHLALVTTYDYDKASRTTTVTQGAGTSTALVTTYVYDKANRLTSTIVDAGASPHLALTTAYTYDKNGNALTKTDAAGKTTRYVYDAQDQLIWTVDAAGDVTKTDYDAEGRVLTVRAYAGMVASGTLSGWGAGSVTASQVNSAVTAGSNDEVTRYVYDKDGRLRFTLDVNLLATEYVYDKANNVIHATEHAAPISAPSDYRYAETILPAVTALAVNAGDRTSRAVYDAANRQIFSIDAAGSVTAFDYDGSGNVIRSTAYAAAYTGTTDPSLSTMQTTWVPANASSANDRVTRTVYDGAGRAAYMVDAMGGATSFAYDGAGHVVKTVRYATVYATTGTAPYGVAGNPTITDMGTWIAGHSGTDDRVSRAVYDSAGRAAYAVDALGFVTEQQYDAVGRVIKTIRYAPSYTVTDSTTFTTLKAALPSSAPADAPVTVYAYDAAGRLTSQTRASGAAEATTTTFTYDGVGRVLTVGNPGGELTTYVYDAVGRTLTTTVKIDASTNAVTANKYDAFGNVVKVTDPRGNIGYFYYDTLNRLTLQVDPEGYGTATSYGFVTGTTPTLGEVTAQIGQQITTVTRYAAATTTSSYSETSPPSFNTSDTANEVTRVYSDKLGRVVQMRDAEGYEEVYTLNAFGERATETKWVTKATDNSAYTLAGVTTNTYDRRGALTLESTAVTSPISSTVTIANSYVYNVFGEQTQAIEASNLSEARTTTYTYDKLGRVTNKAGQSVSALSTSDFATLTTVTPTEQTFYDSRGNVWETIDANGAKTFSYYDLLDRKVAQIDAAGGYSVWTYDANGNVLTSVVYGSPLTATTTPALPTSPGTAPPSPITTLGSRATSYAYDLANRQTGTSISGLITGQYNGSAYSTGTAAVTTSTWYDLAGNVIKQTDGAGSSVYSFYDKRGKKIAQIDQEGYVTAYFKAYGDTTPGLDTDSNVLAERRYATKTTANLASYSTQTALAAVAVAGVLPTASNTTDRVTVFTYDRNGHRLTETRKFVAYSTIDSAGAMTDYTSVDATATYDAVITYKYNGLGEVIYKQEAAGDVTTYVYDSMGRLQTETGPAMTVFVDSSNQAVTAQQRLTTYTYDGLNNVLSTKISRNGYTDATNDQLTTYTYSAGSGRLATVTQAIDSSTSFVRYYDYDAAGHLVRESYDRKLSNGSTTYTEANVTRYDALGRAVMQAKATKNGSVWNLGDRTFYRYNAYGEVTGKGVNVDTLSGGLYQETYDYDAGGRMWRTTSGDGTIKLFINDGAGRATMVISTLVADMSSYDGTSGHTVLDALSFATTNYLQAARTMTVYDKRGQVTQTQELMRGFVGESTGYGFNTISHTKTYNAFGEVASETNGRSFTTSYAYNALGKLTQKTSPSVNFTDETGLITASSPIEYYAYDRSGRMLRVTDANGNVTKRLLMAGTGYGGSDPMVLKEFHADTGSTAVAYDVYGNERSYTNELGKVEYRDYDRLGRLITLKRPVRPSGTATNPSGTNIQLIEYYAYDGLGQRIRHWNNQLVDGSSNPLVEKTDYDVQGRIVSQVDFLSRTTATAYAWSNTLVTTGLQTAVLGGWTKTVTTIDSRTLIDTTDYFGHLVQHTDQGGNVSNSGYDKGGRMISQAGGGKNLTYGYENTGRLGTVTDLTGTLFGPSPVTTSFTYDAEGNRRTESYSSFTSGYHNVWDNEIHQWVSEYYETGTTYEQASATYDGLNRMVSYTNAAYDGGQPLTIAYEYDKAGNVRHMASTFYYVGSSSTTAQDYWYKYDSMNRFVTTMGQLNGARGSGTISRGNAGVGKDILYNLSGQRMSVLSSTATSGESGHWDFDDYTQQQYWVVDYTYSYDADHREDYTYTEDGYLVQTRIADSIYDPNTSTASIASTGYLQVVDTRDAMGRVTLHQEGLAGGSTTALGVIVYSRLATYNAVGNVTWDQVTSLQNKTNASGYDTYVNTTTYTYTGSQLTYTQTATTKNGSNQPTSSNTYTYIWLDDARSNVTTYKPDINSGTNTTSTYAYDINGHLKSVAITGVNARTVHYTTDLQGQIIHRWETNAANATMPQAYYYYFDGQRMGDISNNGPSELDYGTAISRRTLTPSTNQWRYSYASSYANFDQSYDPINSTSQGEAGAASSITVRDGDTLRTLASAAWGDASLWYLIADANGLSSETQLIAGMTLTIPAKVTNTHNNSSTFRVYNPNEAIGDVQPGQPKPPKHNGCGIIGQIIMVAIAVIIAIYLPEMLPNFATMIGGATPGLIPTLVGNFITGAITGAVSSIASQTFGVLSGTIEKFSWSDVARTALTSGMSYSPSQSAVEAGANAIKTVTWKTVLQATAVAAFHNAATQGLMMAVGLQKKFDWTAVAAAGVSGGVSEAVGGLAVVQSHSPEVVKFVKGAAAAVAGAATRSALDGTDFGDNLLAVLPDVIGTVVGDWVAKKVGPIKFGKGARDTQHEAEHGTTTDGNDQSAQSSGGSTAASVDSARAQLLAWMGGHQSDDGASGIIVTSGDEPPEGVAVVSGGMDPGTSGITVTSGGPLPPGADPLFADQPRVGWSGHAEPGGSVQTPVNAGRGAMVGPIETNWVEPPTVTFHNNGSTGQTYSVDDTDTKSWVVTTTYDDGTPPSVVRYNLLDNGGVPFDGPFDGPGYQMVFTAGTRDTAVTLQGVPQGPDPGSIVGYANNIELRAPPEDNRTRRFNFSIRYSGTDVVGGGYYETYSKDAHVTLVNPKTNPQLVIVDGPGRYVIPVEAGLTGTLPGRRSAIYQPTAQQAFRNYQDEHIFDNPLVVPLLIVEAVFEGEVWAGAAATFQGAVKLLRGAGILPGSASKVFEGAEAARLLQADEVAGSTALAKADAGVFLKEPPSIGAKGLGVVNSRTGSIIGPSPLPRKLQARLDKIVAQLGMKRPLTSIRGVVTSDDSIRMGFAWVGPEYRLMSGGEGLVSTAESGPYAYRSFRFAEEKTGVHKISRVPYSKTGVVANFEYKPPSGRNINVHVDVRD